MAVNALQFEVPVVGREPRIEKLGHRDPAARENERARSLLASMSGIALDADLNNVLVHGVRRGHGSGWRAD